MADHNWIRFLEEVNAAKSEICNRGPVWYRGQSNASFILLPSLLRYANGLEKEEFLFSSYRKFSDRIIQRRESEWETLFEMQHYGIPTRLLDWTEALGIALFFAVFYGLSTDQSKADAALCILNPLALNLESKVQKIYTIPRDEGDYSYSKIYWSNIISPKAPIAVEPIFINSRMLAQRGMFTVHDNSEEPVESRFPNAIRRVIIPRNIFPAVIEFLELANINEYSVYPDARGIADFLTHSSGLVHRYTSSI